MRHDHPQRYEHLLLCIWIAIYFDLKCNKTDSNTRQNVQTLLDRAEEIVQEIKIINSRSNLVPLRGKKLGKAGERQEEMTAIIY